MVYNSAARYNTVCPIINYSFLPESQAVCEVAKTKDQTADVKM